MPSEQRSDLLSPSLAKRWREAGADLRAMWKNGRISNEQKKRIIRALVDKVVLRQPQVGQVEIRIVW